MNTKQERILNITIINYYTASYTKYHHTSILSTPINTKSNYKFIIMKWSKLERVVAKRQITRSPVVVYIKH